MQRHGRNIDCNQTNLIAVGEGLEKRIERLQTLFAMLTSLTGRRIEQHHNVVRTRGRSRDLSVQPDSEKGFTIWFDKRIGCRWCRRGLHRCRQG